MLEIRLERFDRVDRAFAERLYAGRGRREGINEGELDKVPARAACLDETTRLGNAHGDLGTLVDIARELSEFATHKIDELGVQLHRFDP